VRGVQTFLLAGAVISAASCWRISAVDKYQKTQVRERDRAERRLATSSRSTACAATCQRSLTSATGATK
jgi:hypothetical protein